MEIFVKDQKLIPKEEWEKADLINRDKLQQFRNQQRKGKKKPKQRNKKTTVINRAKNIHKFRYLFSGGIDSTLIAFLCKNTILILRATQLALKIPKTLNMQRE